ncbi:hypothetical protein BYT27DRAFT_7192198 [Phlegmacium glaucopus]|nr:hypothetical protein BYT27DRAFT_7192198 [Phlegmacium glaucopus]
MTYRQPHFLDCICKCESKRQLLQALLNDINKPSISRPRSFGKVARRIQYDEYQSIGAPTKALVMRHLRGGNIGDIYIDTTPGRHVLYAKTSATEWKKWPGPRRRRSTNFLRHPLYHRYVLWCDPSIRSIGWFLVLQVTKPIFSESAHNLISAVLEKRGEAGGNVPTRNKQSAKRKDYPSDGHEVTPRKLFKRTTETLHNDSQVVITEYSTSPTISVNPTSLEEIARLEKEVIRPKNIDTVLQELVANPYWIPSPAAESSISSQQSISNLLASPLLHSSIPDGTITTSRPALDSSSPKPSKLDVPLSPSPRYTPDFHNEGDRNLRNSSANTAVDSSESTDIVLTTLDPEEEPNDKASSPVTATNAINHTFQEPVMADDSPKMDALDTYQHDSSAGQERKIDPLSIDVDCITTDELDDDHRDIDTGNPVESAASRYLSPEREPLEREENISSKQQSAGNQLQVGGIPIEGTSHVTTEACCLDLHSDKVPEAMAITSDPAKKSHMISSQPFPQRTDPLPTTPDDVVMKDVTPAVSNEPDFRLNCALKEIIFHVSRNSEMICRLCL